MPSTVRTTALAALLLAPALLALAAPASAALWPPPPGTLPVTPPAPAAPMSVGRCIALGQGWFNGQAATASLARDLALEALEHQRAGSNALLAASSAALTPDDDAVPQLFTGLVAGSAAVLAPAAGIPVLLSAGLGPAAAMVVGGTADGLSALAPAPMVLLNDTVVWSKPRVPAAIDPVEEWNNRTTRTALLDVNLQRTFWTGYAGSQLAYPLPLAGTSAALDRGVGGLETALAGASLLTTAASGGAEAMAAGASGLAGVGDSFGSIGVGGDGLAGIAEGATALAGVTQRDAGRAADALAGAGAAGLANVQTLPGQAVACPN